MKLTNEQIELMKEEMYADLVEIIMGEWNCSMIEAMATLYNSETFQRLQDTKTGLYYQSPGYVYDFLNNELRLGVVR